MMRIFVCFMFLSFAACNKGADSNSAQLPTQASPAPDSPEAQLQTLPNKPAPVATTKPQAESGSAAIAGIVLGALGLTGVSAWVADVFYNGSRFQDGIRSFAKQFFSKEKPNIHNEGQDDELNDIDNIKEMVAGGHQPELVSIKSILYECLKDPKTCGRMEKVRYKLRSVYLDPYSDQAAQWLVDGVLAYSNTYEEAKENAKIACKYLFSPEQVKQSDGTTRTNRLFRSAPDYEVAFKTSENKEPKQHTIQEFFEFLDLNLRYDTGECEDKERNLKNSFLVSDLGVVLKPNVLEPEKEEGLLKLDPKQARLEALKQAGQDKGKSLIGIIERYYRHEPPVMRDAIANWWQEAVDVIVSKPDIKQAQETAQAIANVFLEKDNNFLPINDLSNEPIKVKYKRADETEVTETVKQFYTDLGANSRVGFLMEKKGEVLLNQPLPEN